MLVYDLCQAEQLEKQFAEIMDYQLDDFESNLAQLRKKKEILEAISTTKTTNIMMLDDEVIVVIVKFFEKFT